MFSVLEWKQLKAEIHLKVAEKKVKETKTSYTVITHNCNEKGCGNISNRRLLFTENQPAIRCGAGRLLYLAKNKQAVVFSFSNCVQTVW